MTRILLPGTSKASQTRRRNAFGRSAPFGTGQSARSGSADEQTLALIRQRQAMRRQLANTTIGSKGSL